MTDSTHDPIPLCDIRGQYQSLQTEIDAAVLRVLDSGQVILGPEVAAFEQECADYLGVKYALGCGSGTDALLLALHALDIGPGDEVILPPFTFFATLGSVLRVGATPVFVDIDPLTYNLDPTKLEAVLTPRTKVVIPVHLFGQCANMDPIRAIADENRLTIIEDAAQSFGASYEGTKCGALGTISCFSFYPSKNLGTFGDAGLVTTEDEHLHQKLKALRNHGSEVKYYHKYVGWNARIDALHAAILRVKLPYAEAWIEGRRVAAKRYDTLLEEYHLHGFFHRPVVMPYGRHTFNQYVVRVPARHRDPLVKHLKAEGVGCEVYYPLCLHQQECVNHMGWSEGDFPVSEAAAKTVLALPMFPEITEEQQRRVLNVCAEYVRQSLKLTTADAA
jgi:dTDP-4-amino-4,6-dideoxygalactose transaminase